MQYLRIYSKNKMMSGVDFKITVMLVGRYKNLWANPNVHFETGEKLSTNEEHLYDLDVEFRFKDTFRKETVCMSYTGGEIIGGIVFVPEESRPKILLETRYRREKFGEYLVKNCIMRYTPKGKYTFDLVNEGIEKITKQGLAGAAAGFVDNLNAQRDADKRRAEARTKQKEARIRMLKEKKYHRLKALEAEQKALEAKLKAEEKLKLKGDEEKTFSGALFGTGRKSNLFGGETVQVGAARSGTKYTLYPK